MDRSNSYGRFQTKSSSSRRSVSEKNEDCGVKNSQSIWNTNDAQPSRGNITYVQQYLDKQETDLNALVSKATEMAAKHRQAKTDVKRELDSLKGKIKTQQDTIKEKENEIANLNTSQEISSKSWLQKKLDKHPKLGIACSVFASVFCAAAIGLGVYTAVGAIGTTGSIVAAGGGVVGVAAAGPIGWAVLGIAVGAVGAWGIGCCIKAIWDYQRIQQATKAAARAANHA